MSLQKKISLLAGLGILAVLGVLGFLGVQAVKESSDRTLAERLVIAQMVAQGVDQTLGQALGQLNQFASLETVDLEDGDQGPETRAIRSLHRYSGLFTLTFVLDRAGRVLATEPSGEHPLGKRGLDYPNIEKTFRTGQPQLWSGLAPGSDVSIVSLSVPIRNRAGQVTGLVGGNIDLSLQGVSRLIQPIRLGKTAYAEIVNEDGLVIASTKPEESHKTYEETTEHAGRFAALIREGKTLVSTCHRCHTDRAGAEKRKEDVLAFAPLSPASLAPWGVAVRQSEDEALAPTRDLERRMLLTGVPLFLLGVAATWMGARSIARPLANLTASARRIAAGNLQEPVQEAGGAEMGALARSFEEMRLKLKDSLGELEKRAVDIERRARELSALNTVAATVSRSLDLEQMLRDTLDKVLETIPVEAGGIFLKEDTDQQRLWAQRGLSPEFLQQIAQMKAGPGFSGQVTPLAEEAPESGLHSFVSLPLVSKGKVLGSMVLATQEEGLFGPMEVELLTAIGQQIGVAIDNAQLFQEAQKREKEAEALHKIGVEVSALLDLDQILRSVADKARQLLGTETATLALLDDSSQEVYIRAASGTTGQALLQVRLKPGQGMAGKVAGTGQALRTDNYLSDTSFPHDHDTDVAVRDEGLRAFLSVPLKIGVKVFGSLTVADRRSHAFSDRDLDLLSRLANQAAVAIENSQLYARVQDIAVLEERDRISREMHDGLCQVLGYLHLKTRTVEDLVASGQAQKALEEMRDMRKVARDAYDDARQAMAGLRAAGLPQKGLLTPLQEYLQGFRAQSGIPEVELIVKDERATRFASGAEVQLIRVLQEALTNVRRHAQASRVEVRFEVEDDQAIITVEDNGVGFDPSLVTKQRPQHYGLQTMRERAESVGGSLAVDSAPGKGTRVQIRLPKGGG